MDNGKLTDGDLAPIAEGWLRKDAAAAWNAMNVRARELGCELLPSGSMSSYRTYAQQVYLWGLYTRGLGNLAAHPGSSNHGWGLAVDLATQAMRDTLDRIGEQYGWSKKWSDAVSEWWHIKWQEGSWSGVDVGPYASSWPTTPSPSPEPIQEDDVITAVVKKNGAIEVFVEKAKTGEVFHAWQKEENAGWAGSEPGKNASWSSLGTPGSK